MLNLSQLKKDLGSLLKPLGREVLCFSFISVRSPGVLSAMLTSCEESLPGRETSPDKAELNDEEGWGPMILTPYVIPCLKSIVLLDYF